MDIQNGILNYPEFIELAVKQPFEIVEHYTEAERKLFIL